jgi:type IV pilus assembly protein PilY1
MSIFSFQRPGRLFGYIMALAVTAFASLPTADATAISSAAQQASAYAMDPPLGIAGAAPLVMINLSRDHQLFYKAYNDFSSLNNNTVIDTTYSNGNTYSGYFDPTKCYSYSSDSGYFTPTGYVDGTTKLCSNAWSGNFMNWATMTRMDEVRSILYGGFRSTDTAGTTILERAYLPTDAHSFAKFYNGPDISGLIPYSASNVPPSTKGLASTFYYDNQDYGENNSDYRLLRMKGLPDLSFQVGDQIRIVADNSATKPATLEAPVRFLNTSGYDGQPANRVELRVQAGMFTNMACGSVEDCINAFKGYNNWTITNLTRSGVTFCNTTVQGGSTNRSQTNTAPPLIRGVRGNYALWASNESLQCKWSDENSNLQSGFGDGFLSNGNRSAFSGLGSAAENPAKSTGIELIARVRVCVTGLIGSESCEQYPLTSVDPDRQWKPTGLLQKYGETGNIKFGLVTPTFDHNASGGVLRAALPDAGTNDGNFIKNEIDPDTGIFKTTKGIISNINALRIYGYAYDSGDNYGTGNGCTYQQTGITTGTAGGTLVAEGNCSSWGNPMAESYIETLRYLAGKAPNTAFASGSEDGTLGLSVVATWNKPVTEANFCAALNVINFNASSLSYDTDAVSGFEDLNTGKSVTAWTDLVGVGEGINGKNWFVGNTSDTYSGSDKDLCSAKAVANFSGLQGICPESPALKGGYLMAGAAYGAHINRISDLGVDSSGSPIVPANDRTSLKVNTFGVQLATNTPQIRVPVPGSTTGQVVTIIPAYRLVLGGGVGGGALVDFKILSQTDDSTSTTPATVARGSFYADWEDSFAGGDYDQDMWGIISYEITGTQVKITTKPVSASTNNGQGFGYIIGGTTSDGPHFHSGIYGFNYTDPTNPSVYNAAGTLVNGTGSVNSSGGCTNCQVSDPATTAVYAVGTTSAGTLQDPLLYAAKWGGFRADTTKPDGTDTPVNDADPNDSSKWNNDPTHKTTPDNYFLVTNPTDLQKSLDSLFRKILAKVSSGTAAATVAASANGTGVTYQALYEAERTDNNGGRATWIGSLGALWTDSFGLLRVDGNGNHQLDDYVTDPVVNFSYDPGLQRTIATIYVSTDPAKYVPQAIGTQVELTQLATIWNARTQLWNPGLATDTQRAYGSAFNDANGRYIFTWLDANNDGIVGAGEVVPFVYGTTGINDTNYRYLNTDSTAEAANIVNWIRGKEIAGLRNRTVDYGTDNSEQGRVTRLGDIVNSTPLAVSAPAESYDLLYNDTTYANFRSAYRDRRQVVYVGANDGMIHAFNAGFYNASCQRFELQPTNAVCTPSTPGASGTTTSTPTAHPLGAEIWAYVPKNLLPHLRWLTDPSYKHTYYVDGSPIAFDAKIFSADATHTNGWGTVLVVPFRLGGGAITINAPVKNTSGNAVNTNVTADSAYVLMDITNPELPPTVLGEITLPGTWTTSAPAVVMMRDATSGTPNKFYLAIGSGPTNAKAVASNQHLRVNVYNVADFVSASVAPIPTKFDMTNAGSEGGTAAADALNSSAGDLIASDFNLDGIAESVYFGSILGDGSSSKFGGHFWRLLTNGDPAAKNWTAQEMLHMTDATVGATDGMPVTVRPTLGRNARGAPMVYFGTGRLFDNEDKATADTQRIFGLVDTKLLPPTDAQATTKIVLGNLVNVTNVNVNGTTNAVSGLPTGNDALSGVSDFVGLASAFNAPGIAGWYRNLATNGPSNPSERVVSAQALLGGLLLTAAYTPGTSICTGLGTSVLYGQNYETGTGDPSGFFGVNSTTGNVNVTSEIGAGLPAPPSLHTGNGSNADGGKTVTACTQTSTGAIVCKDVATLKPVTSGESSWREPLGK